jgi:hypothetical protein
MNAFAIGFGSALATAFAAWLVILAAPTPGPGDPWVLVAVVALGSGAVLLFAWLGLRGALLGIRPRDLRAEFRAADPRGWRSAIAGFLSGVAGLAALVAAARAGGPGEGERDVRLLRFMALGLGGLAASPVVGVLVFLWAFGSRTGPPPPPPGD